jgi:hypothetical protein
VSFKEEAQDVKLAEALEFGLWEAHERKFLESTSVRTDGLVG